MHVWDDSVVLKKKWSFGFLKPCMWYWIGFATDFAEDIFCIVCIGSWKLVLWTCKWIWWLIMEKVYMHVCGYDILGKSDSCTNF